MSPRVISSDKLRETDAEGAQRPTSRRLAAVVRDASRPNPVMGRGAWGFIYDSNVATGANLVDDALYGATLQTTAVFGFNTPQEAQDGCAMRIRAELEMLPLEFKNVMIVQRLRHCVLEYEGE